MKERTREAIEDARRTARTALATNTADGRAFVAAYGSAIGSTARVALAEDAGSPFGHSLWQMAQAVAEEWDAHFGTATGTFGTITTDPGSEDSTA